jgi:hypothetical protein
MDRKLTISKLDAAKRQLDTLIRLYFNNDDPVSIHTLAAASYNVLKDLNKKRGGKPMFLKEQFLDLIREDRRKEIHDLVNEAENFFKHADRDPESALEFNPEQTDLLIHESCSVYSLLSGESPPLLRLFQGWYMARNPDLFILPEEQMTLLKKLQPDAISLGRAAYFKKMLPVVMKLGT